ncbi:MAG: polysaccharide deacetylase family protein [Bacteroidota bacterium]
MWTWNIINPAFLSGLIFPRFTYRIKNSDDAVFLTFDDGPHPVLTPFVLDALAKYGAKATFFMLGCNVEKHPELVKRILDEGHAIGNHTYNHLNGWQTNKSSYLKDISQASGIIRSNLFRPPYGRILPSQSKKLMENYKIVMWDVMSYDFHLEISTEKCLSNVLNHVKPGSIVVFHENDKASTNLQYVLPKVLEVLSNNGYRFLPIKDSDLKD